MATFYPSSTNQRVVIGNSYFRDPAVHTLYPESAVSGNMAYLNYSSSGPYSEALAGCTDSQPNGIGFTDSVASHLGENGYNFWRDGRNEMLSMQANDGSRDGGGDHQMGLQPELGILSGHNLSFQQSKISNVQGRGLSLSLGMQIPVPTFKYQPAGSDVSIFSCYQSSPGNEGTSRDDNSRRKILNACVLPFELTGITSTIPNFKYLKPAQQLLDEVVNVHKALEQKAQSGNTFRSPACKDNNDGSKSDVNPSNHQESTANSPSGLSQPVRQDLQSKTTKLLAMLDEIDRRYKQYYHQMQIVVSSFDATVGSGAAKPYTILALRTISRHFRCLRDAVGCQIQSTQKILGEQDGSRGKGCGISRLRYIDQKMRQQRVIQQLGVMPQHVWRPQRGLPENSVSILRAWLFEHFLHPYPNDSEKLMLARQTGLTRSQESRKYSGTVEDCACGYETVDSLNEEVLHPILQELVATPFFRYFKVKLWCDCPFWPDDGMCRLRDCSVCECPDNEFPEPFKKPFAGLPVDDLICQEGKPEAVVDRTLDSKAFRGWFEIDNPWTHDDETDNAEMTYVNLQLNPERYTGFVGPSARRIWESIYTENCPKYPSGEICPEKRVLYKLISGLHASISAHIASDYLLDDITNLWGPNLGLLYERVLKYPDRVRNLYFTFLFVLRAVTKAADYLEQAEYNTGNSEEDLKTKSLVRQLVYNPKLQAACPVPFDEAKLWQGESGPELKQLIQKQFRNISALMDCVGCEKCRLWGKLQVLGLGTAMKILFSVDGQNYINQPLQLQRNEVIALVNLLNRLSESVNFVHEMRPSSENIMERRTSSLARKSPL